MIASVRAEDDVIDQVVENLDDVVLQAVDPVDDDGDRRALVLDVLDGGHAARARVRQLDLLVAGLVDRLVHPVGRVPGDVHLGRMVYPYGYTCKTD
eukprot:2737782-Prymnesium_polylepis.1